MEVNTKESRQLSGYVLIEKDLRDTLVFLRLHQKFIIDQQKELSSASLDDKSTMLLHKALVRAAVVTYGKCFAGTKGKGENAEGRRAKLKDDIISEENKKLHEFLMSMRNKYVAHAGQSEHESCKMVIAIPPKNKFKKGQDVIYMQCSELFQSVTSQDMLVSCDSLIEELSTWVKDKISHLEKRIIGKGLNPEEVYKLKKTKNNRITLEEKSLERLKS